MQLNDSDGVHKMPRQAGEAVKRLSSIDLQDSTINARSKSATEEHAKLETLYSNYSLERYLQEANLRPAPGILEPPSQSESISRMRNVIGDICHDSSSSAKAESKNSDQES